ncbi:MAG TPA: MASE1 domain-containing protein [Anaerolineales bacterium]|nr:MASE1 domain-containing protein [Anaerolineales bacterium]
MRSTNSPSKRPLAVDFMMIIALALVYHLAARLGLEMAYVQINTSPVWPPTGIALAALLLFGYRLWPGVSLGVLLGSLLNGAQFNIALGMALGNTLEALAGAYCLKRFFDFHNAMDRIQDVVGLAVVGLFSTAISATLGATTLTLTGASLPESFGAIWITWWVGDLLGALVVAPALLVWATRTPFHHPRRASLEAGALLALLALVAGYAFSDRPSASIYHQALIYLIFPFIIWAALRWGQRGATAGVILVSGIAILRTVQGVGPFSLASKNDSLVLLQTFTAVVSLTSLILAAATLERRTASETLRQRADDLATLNESSKAFLDNADLSGIYQSICQLAVTRLGLDAAWIETEGHGSSQGRLVAAQGIPERAISDLDALWDADSPAQDHKQGRWRTIDDLPSAAQRAETPYPAYASVPLILGGKPFGLLKLLSKDKLFFTAERQLLIQSYANLAAVVIQNAWLFEEVRRSNRQLHALSQRLMQAQEQERLHLSRELHDESGQLLAGLLVQLGLLERDAERPEAVRKQVSELKETTGELQENLHKLAVDLRPASLDHLGLVTALQQYVSEFSRQYTMQVEFEAVGMQPERLPIEVETALFRIVQESLTNVVLHAQASRVDVLISQRNGQVVATIEDNGVGFIPSSATFEDHLGLFGMRERVEMLGGKFTVESSPGKGTTVNVEVPCHA